MDIIKKTRLKRKVTLTFAPSKNNAMKHILLAAAVLISSASFSQIKAPKPSPTATISQEVGLAKVDITYSRPGIKERKIFGELVAYDKMWRLGANAPTKISFSEDVTVGGKEVAAGDYVMFAIPGASSWEMVINKNAELGGMGDYDKAEDAARFMVETTPLKDTWETFTIEFSNMTTAGAHMVLGWENTSVHVPIETKTMEMMEKQIKKELVDGPGAGSYAAGARFYLGEKKELDLALTWMTKACEMRPDAFWYLYNKAQIQAELGKNADAIATATKSMEMAKANEEGDYGYVANNEKLIAELKAKK
jgi:tetratricopeptide (TPR) repeat protein